MVFIAKTAKTGRKEKQKMKRSNEVSLCIGILNGFLPQSHRYRDRTFCPESLCGPLRFLFAVFAIKTECSYDLTF